MTNYLQYGACIKYGKVHPVLCKKQTQACRCQLSLVSYWQQQPVGYNTISGVINKSSSTLSISSTIFFSSLHQIMEICLVQPYRSWALGLRDTLKTSWALLFLRFPSVTAPWPLGGVVDMTFLFDAQHHKYTTSDNQVRTLGLSTVGLHPLCSQIWLEEAY